jgi:hypothetical protein
MKNLMKIATLLLICTASTTFTGCKKGDKGDMGPQGQPGTNRTDGTNGTNGATGPAGAPGPDAKTYNYNLTFGPSTTFQSYTGVGVDFDANNVVVTYVKNATYGSEDFYVALPYVASGLVNIYAEVGEDSGLIFINTVKADGTPGSPWTSSTTFAFKSVLIKSRAMKTHPNLNLKDYSEVMRAFNLK